MTLTTDARDRQFTPVEPAVHYDNDEPLEMKDEDSAAPAAAEDQGLLGRVLLDAPVEVSNTVHSPAGPQKSSQWGQLLACGAVMSLNLMGGVCLAHSSSLIPALEAADSDVPVTKAQSPWIASTLVLSVPLGALLALLLNDRLGRLSLFRLMVLPNVAGWVLIASTGSLGQVIAGRLLLGASIGLMHGTCLLYCSEVAEKNIRGALGALGTAFASVGILLCYVMGKFMHWRTHAWANCGVPLLPLLLLQMLSPESPVWLKDQGQDEASAGASARLYNDPTKLLSVSSNAAGTTARGKAMGWDTVRMLFTSPMAYKPLLIVQAIFVVQQLVGIYITIYYAVPLLEETGSELDPYTVSIYIGVVRLVGCAAVAVVMPRLGRRPLMLASSVGQAAAMATSGWATRAILAAKACRSACPAAGVAGCVAVCGAPSPWWVVSGILAYIACGCLGWQVLPWTMMAELFPHEVRSLAQPLNSSTAHLYMFAVLQMYYVLKQLLGGAAGLQFLFAASSALSALFVWVWLPETRGRTLREIEDYFRDHTTHLSARRAKRAKLGQQRQGIV